MGDESVLGRINDLVDEEHRLRGQLAAGEITSAEEQTRLRTLEEQLDQCWDLLRRRRAARREGQDDDALGPRPPEEVERYLQ